MNTTFIKYFSSSIVATIIGILSGFFTYRYINPHLLGVWSLFTIIEVYATFSRLGVLNGLGRELPYYSGKKQISHVTSLAEAALFYSLGSNLLLLIIIPLSLFLLEIEIASPIYYYTLLAVVLRLVTKSYSDYLSVTFRTSNDFNTLSNISNTLSFVKVSLLPGIAFWGYWGLLFREITLSILEMVLLHSKRPLNHIIPKYNIKALVSLVKVGLPLFLTSYIVGFTDTLPRLYLAKSGTPDDLGLFSPLLVILGIVLTLPNSISSYMYPKMAFSYGETGDKKILWDLTKKTAALSFALSIPLFIAVYFLADLSIYLFPKYENAVPYIKVGAISMLFIGFKVNGLVFSVLKNWKALYLYVGLYLFWTILCLSILPVFFNDVLMVSTITLIVSNGLSFFSSLFLSYKVLHS